MQDWVAETMALLPAGSRRTVPAGWNPFVARGQIVPGSGNTPEVTRRSNGPWPTEQWHNQTPVRGPHGNCTEERE